jgi:hypothetical protein
MQLRPLRVRRVGTVVDHRRPFACLLGVGRDGEVGADHLNAFRELGWFTPNCGTHPITSRREMAGYGETERTRPEDDVQFRFVRLLRCQGPHLRCWTRHNVNRPDAPIRRIDAPGRRRRYR